MRALRLAFGTALAMVGGQGLWRLGAHDGLFYAVTSILLALGGLVLMVSATRYEGKAPPMPLYRVRLCSPGETADPASDAEFSDLDAAHEHATRLAGYLTSGKSLRDWSGCWISVLDERGAEEHRLDVVV